MSDKSDFWGPDPFVYAANKAKFPPEELRKYAGQWVAWSLDGTRILAGDPDPLKLEEKMIAAGLDPQQAVYSAIPPDDGSDGQL